MVEVCRMVSVFVCD
jgi:hypothetical protein